MWKNSFMDNLPLSDDMRYYSGHYKPCAGISDCGWCNIPKKADKAQRANDSCLTHMWCMPTRDCLIGTLTMTGVEEFYWTLRRLWISVQGYRPRQNSNKVSKIVLNGISSLSHIIVPGIIESGHCAC